jgi:predicted DNA-binding protein YlxM (UPF0122 family)
MGNCMDNVYEMSMLLDFYGQLLTDRQYEMLDLHCNNDYSLGEIAQQLNISRQGVYDNIKRSKAILNEMEEKLGLVKKFSRQRKKAEEVLEILKNINIEVLDEKDKMNIVRVKEGIEYIINSI